MDDAMNAAEQEARRSKREGRGRTTPAMRARTARSEIAMTAARGASLRRRYAKTAGVQMLDERFQRKEPARTQLILSLFSSILFPLSSFL